MIALTEANTNQIPTIQAIAHKTWPVTFENILSPQQIEYMLDMMYSKTALKKQINDLGHRFLLANKEKKSLGFISYERPYREQKETKIHKIYVLPEAQGLGVGKTLMEAVEHIARNNGDQKLLLNVNKHNEAEKFYERLGFKLIGMEDIAIGSGFLMEDKIFCKNLGN